MSLYTGDYVSIDVSEPVARILLAAAFSVISACVLLFISSALTAGQVVRVKRARRQELRKE